MDFKLVSDYTPQGDQGRAIEALLRGIYDREAHQVLLGVTGSGKTFTMAKVIEAVQKPTDRKSTRLNSSHMPVSRMPSSA